MMLRKSIFALLFFFCLFNVSCAAEEKKFCMVGAFVADNPSKNDIINFKNTFGKKPYLIMVFLDWGSFVNQQIINDIYAQGSVLFVTLEPWVAETKQGVDYDGILSGKYDGYLNKLAASLSLIQKDVFLRFAHEANGDWYPWAGCKIGKEKYIKIYQYVKDVFDKNKADNVRWVFSVNWEDIPKPDNSFAKYYPGDKYVDYIGIDGYNWGTSKPWSKWMSFSEIFMPRYQEALAHFNKPVIISEFSSVSSGGNKAQWIREALLTIKSMDKVKAFVLFNQDKEVDWAFSPGSKPAKELALSLKDGYFQDFLKKTKN